MPLDRKVIANIPRLNQYMDANGLEAIAVRSGVNFTCLAGMALPGTLARHLDLANTVRGFMLLWPRKGEPVIVRSQMTLDPARHLCTWKNEPVELTVTEFLILKSLAQRPGHVKNRDQLMDAAYGEHIYVDDRTIDSHIKRLRKKFKSVDTEFAQIETLYGVGYRYRDR